MSSAIHRRRVITRSPRACGAVLAGIGLLLAGCGGGGGNSAVGSNAVASTGGVGYTAGIYPASSGLKNQCSSAASQNNFLRSWTNETYLWYAEVLDRNPNGTATATFFDQLKTTALTSSGNAKDRFHFTYPTDEWQALSQSGIQAGYGMELFFIKSDVPRQVVVAYVEPGSPAAVAGLARGDTVLSVDGADAVNGGTGAIVDTLNAGLFPSAAGQAHSLSVRTNAGATRAVTLTSANVTMTPVRNVGTIPTANGLVGYILFNDHVATSERALLNAVSQLKTAGIVDLVLDLRYNGGGYLDIASGLAYMIAGAARTTGMTFENIVFNDKSTTRNPVTGALLAPDPFQTREQFSTGTALTFPTLDLARVFVITGAGTCSASESIINGLRGVNVQVIQIGGTTCGKPYGFYPTDNCGTTYFSIQFKGENAAGFGDYPDGFSPANTLAVAGVTLPGCSVADDFSHELGDVNEGRLAAALNYRASGACPSAPPGVVRKPGRVEDDGQMMKSPWRENRILRAQ